MSNTGKTSASPLISLDNSAFFCLRSFVFVVLLSLLSCMEFGCSGTEVPPDFRGMQIGRFIDPVTSTARSTLITGVPNRIEFGWALNSPGDDDNRAQFDL